MCNIHGFLTFKACRAHFVPSNFNLLHLQRSFTPGITHKACNYFRKKKTVAENQKEKLFLKTSRFDSRDFFILRFPEVCRRAEPAAPEHAQLLSMRYRRLIFLILPGNDPNTSNPSKRVQARIRFMTNRMYKGESWMSLISKYQAHYLLSCSIAH